MSESLTCTGMRTVLSRWSAAGSITASAFAASPLSAAPAGAVRAAVRVSRLSGGSGARLTQPASASAKVAGSSALFSIRCTPSWLVVRQLAAAEQRACALAFELLGQQPQRLTGAPEVLDRGVGRRQRGLRHLARRGARVVHRRLERGR